MQDSPPTTVERDLLRRIGCTFKARRLELRLSQIDLALKAQIHRTYTGDIEQGDRNITVIVLFRLARALGISFVEIAQLVEEDQVIALCG